MRRVACAALATGILALFVPAALAMPVCTFGSAQERVRFETTMGDIVVDLCSDDAPNTVDNFLTYVDDGAYTDTGFLHRSVQGCPNVESPPGSCSEENWLFIVQGGGYYVDAGVIQSVETRDPIDLENRVQNVYGSLSMARTSVPNSATSQWFFNTAHNQNLDHDPDAVPEVVGYAVFGEVVMGFDVLNAIAAQETRIFNIGWFEDVPLDSYPGGGASVLDHMIYVTDIVRLPEPGAGLQAGAALATLALALRRRAASRRRGR